MKNIIIFLFGVYIGQEFGETIPNVKKKSVEMYDNFIKTDFYKKLKEDMDMKKNE